MNDFRRSAILTGIRHTMKKQDDKWGADRDLPDLTWLRIIVEEIGEVARTLEPSDETPAVLCLRNATSLASSQRKRRGGGLRNRIWQPNLRADHGVVS